MTVDGVAIATVVSQVISCILILITLFKSHDCYKLRLNDLKINKKAFFENLPIPKYINTDLQNQIKTAKPTDDIEQLICRLYGFTNEECMSISM